MADNEKYACGYKNSQTGEIVYYKDKDARSQLKDIANLISQDGGGLNFDNLTVSNTVSSVVNDTIIGQDYLGGYIEIQPDSWDGSACSVDSITKTWGFPISLLPTEQERIKNMVFNGKGNIMYIRFPLGFAYRGYRNIDETSGLAKNIGERFAGQNKRLKLWFEDISNSGGGLAPEYWCPPPYWLTSGSYSGNNQISAGGNYDRTITLASIKSSDLTQYNAQIDAFTDAIVNDLEYLHQNIAPVRMFGLQNEPSYSTQPYGACKYDAQTYNDILEVLYPKIQASTILSTYNDEENEVKLLVASSDENSPFTGIAKTFIENHSDLIWGYTHHSMRKASGESSGIDTGADWYKSTDFSNIKGNKTNVFINEYEYFNTNFGTDDFRCSNNMLHLINELVYGEAKVLHPIIHICKPLGQSLSSTNTKGYCMFATNLKGEYGIDITNSNNEYGLNKGTFIPNTWAYNSWSMFGDNLPVGAYLVGEYTNKIANAGWCTYKYNGKLHIFMANNSNNNAKISLTFNENKEFDGKMYSMNYCGTKINDKKGKTIDFVIPAYSGQCWIEKDFSTIELIPCTNITLDKSTLSFTTIDTQTLTATLTPANTTDTVAWSVNPTGICTVDNGTVSPIKNGTCTITATCGSQSATCNVTVSGITTQYSITNNLTNCTNSNSTTTVEENSSYSANITATDGHILENVIITMGEIDITSTTYNDGQINIDNVTGNVIITASAIVNNSKPCTNISVDKSTLTFTSTDTQILTASVTPSDTDDELIYTTNPIGIVSINNGIVTPIANGNCVITATCGIKTATCNVTVSGITTQYSIECNQGNDYINTDANRITIYLKNVTISPSTTLKIAVPSNYIMAGFLPNIVTDPTEAGKQYDNNRMNSTALSSDGEYKGISALTSIIFNSFNETLNNVKWVNELTIKNEWSLNSITYSHLRIIVKKIDNDNIGTSEGCNINLSSSSN